MSSVDQIPLDKGIAALFLVLRTVEELKLKKLKHITGKGLQSISSKTLQSVNLRESSSFTDAGVKALVHNCPNVEELNLSELHKLTDSAIVAAAESLKDNLVSGLFYNVRHCMVLELHSGSSTVIVVDCLRTDQSVLSRGDAPFVRA